MSFAKPALFTTSNSTLPASPVLYPSHDCAGIRSLRLGRLESEDQLGRRANECCQATEVVGKIQQTFSYSFMSKPWISIDETE